MQEAINEMLRASPYPSVTVEYEVKQVPSAEEWAIPAFVNMPTLGEHCGLQTVAEYMTFYEECQDAGLEAIAIEMWNDDVKPENYVGQGDSLTTWCEAFLNDTGFFEDIKGSNKDAK